MTSVNEGNNDELEKSELLPTGNKAKKIVEVLVAMYRAMYNPVDTTDDDAKDEHAGQ